MGELPVGRELAQPVRHRGRVPLHALRVEQRGDRDDQPFGLNHAQPLFMKPSLDIRGVGHRKYPGADHESVGA